jgi:RNA polymerase Rpb1, domain 7
LLLAAKHNNNDNNNRASPWLLRIELKKEVAFVKGLSIRTISAKIAESFGNALHILGSDDNADKQVLQTTYLST